MSSARDVVMCTFREVQKVSTFNKISRTRLETFSVDLSFVALRIRTAYLFDAFPVGRKDEPTLILADLISRLRETISTYDDVVFMHEPIYDQYFFVNTILFQERYRVEVHSPSSWISWVLLEQPPVILPVPPTRLLHLIQLLHNSLGSCDKSSPLLTLQLPEDTTICDAVPLAAFLLEYPVAYFPVSPDQTSFLPRILLDVYECIIGDVGLDERRQHTFMKFSCPSGLSSRDLLVELKSLFSKRLEAAGVTGEYQVRKHEEIHDRVAL